MVVDYVGIVIVKKKLSPCKGNNVHRNQIILLFWRKNSMDIFKNSSVLGKLLDAFQTPVVFRSQSSGFHR